MARRFLTGPCKLKRARDGSVLLSCTFGPGIEVAAKVPRSVYRKWIQVQRGAHPAAAPPALRGHGARRVGEAYAVGADYVIGNFWNDLGKVVANIHRNKIVQGVAATALSIYGVPPGVTMKAMDVTANLVDRARGAGKGSAAHQEVKQVAARARAGDRGAIQIARAAQHLERSRRRATLALELVERAARGDARARDRLNQIALAARTGDPRAVLAGHAVRAAVSAIRQTPPPPVVPGGRFHPPPPAVRRPSTHARAARLALPPGQPPPPAFRGGAGLHGRVVSRQRLPNGHIRIVVDSPPVR